MHTTTIHTFPAMQSLHAPRAWMMVVTVLIHAALFWSLSQGLSRSVITFVRPPLEAAFIDEEVQPLPPPPPPPDYQPQIPVQVPIDFIPQLGPVAENTITTTIEPVPQPAPQPEPEVRPAPIIVQPQIDPRRPLSEPLYPPADVRAGNTGTVLLSVLILPDGSVGDVRLERSSGHSRLDASALSEAKRWRFHPGTQDGAPIAMWKQLPVTFRLQ